MLWKFFRPLLLLDALFDDGWCGLGLPEAVGTELPSTVEPLLG